MPKLKYELVLASSSLIKLKLLGVLGFSPTVHLSLGLDERLKKKELPRLYAIRLASNKIISAAVDHPGAIIVATQNIIAVGRKVISKHDFCDSLNLLSGKRHKIYSVVAWKGPNEQKVHTKVTINIVKIKRMTDVEIVNYTNSYNGRMDVVNNVDDIYGHKSGLSEMLIEFFSGSYSGALGINLNQVNKILKQYQCKLVDMCKQ